MNKHIGYSVVIPVKNGLDFLESAISTILAQTVKATDIVVVDDHSSDGSFQLAHRLKSITSIPIEVAYSNKVGVSAARNIGIDLAKEDCIALLDVDDLWLPNKMEKELSLYRPDRLVHTGYFLVNHNLEPLGTFLPHNSPSTESIYTQKYVVTGSASSTIFSRNAFNKAGRFDEELQVAEDLDLWIRLSSILDVIGVSEPLVKVRRHAGSVQSLGKDFEYLRLEMFSLTRVWSKNQKLCPHANPPLDQVLGNFFAATKFSPVKLLKVLLDRKFMSAYLNSPMRSKLSPFGIYLIRLKKIIVYKCVLRLRKSMIFRGFHKAWLILRKKI